MPNPKLIYPESEDCPKTIAEAIYQVHYGSSDQRTHDYLKNFWGTADYLIQAVDYVYKANFWPLGRKEKKVYRDIFKGVYPQR